MTTMLSRKGRGPLRTPARASRAIRTGRRCMAWRSVMRFSPSCGRRAMATRRASPSPPSAITPIPRPRSRLGCPWSVGRGGRHVHHDRRGALPTPMIRSRCAGRQRGPELEVWDLSCWLKLEARVLLAWVTRAVSAGIRSARWLAGLWLCRRRGLPCHLLPCWSHASWPSPACGPTSRVLDLVASYSTLTLNCVATVLNGPLKEKHAYYHAYYAYSSDHVMLIILIILCKFMPNIMIMLCLWLWSHSAYYSDHIMPIYA